MLWCFNEECSGLVIRESVRCWELWAVRDARPGLPHSGHLSAGKHSEYPQLKCPHAAWWCECVIRSQGPGVLYSYSYYGTEDICCNPPNINSFLQCFRCRLTTDVFAFIFGKNKTFTLFWGHQNAKPYILLLQEHHCNEDAYQNYQAMKLYLFHCVVHINVVIKILKHWDIYIVYFVVCSMNIWQR